MFKEKYVAGSAWGRDWLRPGFSWEWITVTITETGDYHFELLGLMRHCHHDFPKDARMQHALNKQKLPVSSTWLYIKSKSTHLAWSGKDPSIAPHMLKVFLKEVFFFELKKIDLRANVIFFKLDSITAVIHIHWILQKKNRVSLHIGYFGYRPITNCIN